MTCAALEVWRTRQSGERRAAAKVREDTGYAFTEDLGRPLLARRVSALFRNIVRDSMPPRIQLHDLRYTAATLALTAGITIDTYSQVVGESQSDAAARVAALIYPGLQVEQSGRGT